jgi:NADPH-dependent curcumin reductase CurA
MSESQWVKQGETFSHKNACKEFGLKEEEIIDAMKAGKLQYRQNYAHGNPYFRVLRTEIEALAAELHGKKVVENQKIKHKLRTLTREINSLKRKLASLEKQKVELLEIQNHVKA